jgi:hypothetical protein
MDLVRCYRTQFGSNGGKNKDPQTRLSSARFMEWLRGMHSFYGHQAGVEFGEAYCVKGPLGVGNVAALL